MPSDLCLGHSDLLLSVSLQLEQGRLPHLKVLDLIVQETERKHIEQYSISIIQYTGEYNTPNITEYSKNNLKKQPTD